MLALTREHCRNVLRSDTEPGPQGGWASPLQVTPAKQTQKSELVPSVEDSTLVLPLAERGCGEKGERETRWWHAVSPSSLE